MESTQRTAASAATATPNGSPSPDASVSLFAAQADGAAPPRLRTSLPPDDVLRALDKRAVRGKLPGFEPLDGDSFKVALFGEPFDRDLIGVCSRDGEDTLIDFRSRLRLKAPVILIATLVVSIWPGVLLMDSLIPASWGWWDTWTWYIPLVVVQVPLVLPWLLKRSRRSIRDHLREQLERIASGLDASIDG